MNSLSSASRMRVRGLALIGCVLALLLSACAPLTLETPPAVTDSPTDDFEAMATPFPVDYFTSLPPEQRTFEVAFVLTNEALLQTVTPEPPPSGPPPTYTPEPFVTGIFSDTYGPLSPTFIPSSHWQGIVNGEQTFVYAGARKSDSVSDPISSQGLVYVLVYSTDFATRNETEYEAPGETGLLTIAEESNLRLIIAAPNGSTLYFDIPSRSFVDSLTATAPAPTVTPIPPATPTAPPLPTVGYPPPQSTTSVATVASP